jgi:hypothetical protein
MWQAGLVLDHAPELADAVMAVAIGLGADQRVNGQWKRGKVPAAVSSGAPSKSAWSTEVNAQSFAITAGVPTVAVTVTFAA